MKKISFITTCTIVFCLFIITVCVASDIALVKNATMKSFQTTTVGNAFDASFDEPKWEEFKGKKGERVVQFRGNISQDLHNTAVKALLGRDPSQVNEVNALNYVNIYSDIVMKIGVKKAEELGKGKNNMGAMAIIIQEFANNHHWVPRTPVVVQWIISPNGDSFQLNSMGSEAWEGIELIEILKIIYT